MTKIIVQEGSCNDLTDEREHLLHVHDLPQLYTRPPFNLLSKTLDLLRIQSTSFSTSTQPRSGPKVDPQGVPRYLTSIISSSLSWLKDDSEREQIWDSASVRLSERSGRNAMPSMTRTFHITDEISIDLFEPSLTEDKLGLKTWTSSLLLARRLPQLRHHLEPGCKRILELGSGTGLVGIAAAMLWNVDVVLTDLPEIIQNLERNVQSNEDQIQRAGQCLQVRSLDWADNLDVPASDDEKFSLIIVADPIYSSDHPRILVEAMSRWIRRNSSARFVVELPLRKGYEKERMDLRNRLAEVNMVLIEEGTEVGFDDWEGVDGRPLEVECWWSIWRLFD